MEQNNATPPLGPDSDEGSSLEGEATQQVISPSDGYTQEQPITAPGNAQPVGSTVPVGRKHRLADLWHRGSVYLLFFVLLFIVCLIVLFVFYTRNKKTNTPQQATVKTQDLSGEALQQLANSGGLEVGDAKQVLNIQSNAVFAGTALVRGDLQVAGNIKTGGALTLTSLSVSGSGSFGRLQAQDLAVAGRGAFTGQLSTQGAFNAAGGGSFGGPVSTPTLNANTLPLAGNLVLNNHIQAGGARPSASGGNALGSGGTTNLSGSDTSGSIVINTGGGPTAGCFTNVRFARAFSNPHVIVTPVGGAAGGLDWYVNRSGNGFSVCTNSPAPGGQSFGFDYFVTD